MTARCSAAAMILSAAMLVACFDPVVSEGLACGPDQSCPAGQTCDNGVCRSDAVIDSSTPDAPVMDAPALDAASDAPPSPDARPDAMPVDCTGDTDCQEPPDNCFLPGTCDLSDNTCTFPAVDCSDEDSECTVGVCDPVDGTCVAQPASEDATCGAQTTCGSFGACEVSGGTCATEGTRSRSCNDFTCQGGTCTMGSAYTDTEACSVNTDGVECGTMTTSNCDPCQYANACALTGSQSCTCTQPECSGGSCQSVQTSCQQTCTRNTDGDVCGSETVCGSYGACSYSSDCTNSGTRTRTCNDYSCSGGSCTKGPDYTQQATCTRNTSGNSCGSGTVCGSYGACQYTNSCSPTGTKTRTCNDYTCSNQSCSKGPNYTQSTQTGCGRDTAGDLCGFSTAGCPVGQAKDLCCSSGSCNNACSSCQ